MAPRIAATQDHVLSHPANARTTRAARIVVFDSYAKVPARAVDIHLALRPGTCGAAVHDTAVWIKAADSSAGG